MELSEKDRILIWKLGEMELVFGNPEAIVIWEKLKSRIANRNEDYLYLRSLQHSFP